MFGKKPPQVLVVGAGPVGLFAALALTRHGVRVQIVDKEWRTGKHSYALALHAASLQMLDEVGLLGDVLEKSYRVRGVGLYDGRGRRGAMRVSDLAEDHSFVAVMRQADLEGALEQALQKQGVKVQWSHELAELAPRADGVEVEIDKLDRDTVGYGVQSSTMVVAKVQKLQMPFVIGADGHRSRVRRALGVDFPEVGKPQDFAVFEFKSDFDHGHEMRVALGERTADVCWPLPGGYCRWSFEIPRLDDLQERQKERTFGQVGYAHYPVLAEQHLHELLRERAPWFDGSVEDVRWRMAVRFERRLADRFGEGRVWLCGDAGHLTGPGGVQSMNVGLREARDLAAILDLTLRGEASSAALEQYGGARRAEWRRLLGLDPGLRASAQTEAWIGAERDRLLSSIPASGADLARLAEQVGLSF